MPAIRVRPTVDGRIGPLDGPFTIESDEADPQGQTVAVVVQFARWVRRGLSSYNNKGGLEDSSLFKSFVGECYAELAIDNPDAAASLTNLVVNCADMPEPLKGDRMWRLHRAIFASLPGSQILD